MRRAIGTAPRHFCGIAIVEMAGNWTSYGNHTNDVCAIIDAYTKAPALRGQMVSMMSGNEVEGFFLCNGLEL
jgi:hypothetical protein